jgi:hypothetical protein
MAEEDENNPSQDESMSNSQKNLERKVSEKRLSKRQLMELRNGLGLEQESQFLGMTEEISESPNAYEIGVK